MTVWIVRVNDINGVFETEGKAIDWIKQHCYRVEWMLENAIEEWLVV